jgi:hypothetical protein
VTRQHQSQPEKRDFGLHNGEVLIGKNRPSHHLKDQFVWL